jgi:phage shock protein PspC (stress-responsive transcriptional regulator)
LQPNFGVVANIFKIDPQFVRFIFFVAEIGGWLQDKVACF